MGRGGIIDSTRLWINFFLNSTRDAGEPQNLVSCLKFNGETVNTSMKHFFHESREMTVCCKSPCQKVVKFHLYCHNF